MRTKGFSLLILGVILTTLPACDNVGWGGFEVELRSPEPPPSAMTEEEPSEEDEERPPEPIRLGPLVYLAEREGAEARLLPVAEWREGAYHPLPTDEETPDLVERFPLERWDAGTEFVLLHRGVRAGTFVSDGSSTSDVAGCRLRPAGRGQLEVHPEAGDATHFLAVRKEDVAEGLLPPEALRSAAIPQGLSAADRREVALSVGRYLIPRAEIPWPPSIPEILHRTSEVGTLDGAPLLAATFLFGDDPEVGNAMPSSYAFLTVAVEGDEGFDPIWLWFQPAREGKAIPRILASGTLIGEAPDMVLEILGVEERGLAILGVREGEWSLLYRDDCAPGPSSGAAGAWP